ncbi:hypothetical protein MLD38_002621 [Melastoma candidum]|uniref:Uncharacterized protein n=1 Tax=Melastoma candidum TaxID=119954 RepID=A0ACB9S3P3_9MYRT|nr:hypothetical protein MLD38_002621 [Melastoma candidum]
MSFELKNLLVSREASVIPNAEINPDKSLQNEGKRSHQWFMDTGPAEPELLSNKRQALVAVTSGDIQGPTSVFSWDNNSNFHFQPLSGQPAHQLGGSEALDNVNLVDRHVAALSTGEIGMSRKFFDNHYGNESAVSLSMSHGANDPSLFLNFGGIRKVKVNEVRDPEHSFSASIGDHFGRGDAAYNKGDGSTMSLGAVYTNRDENIMPLDAGFTKIGENFLSAGHSFSREDGNLMGMAQSFNQGDENLLARPFPKEGGQFISMVSPYAKGEAGIVSMASPFDKDHGNFISMGANIGKMSENFISVGSSYGKMEENMINISRSYDKASSTIIPTDSNSMYQKGDPNSLMMGQNYRGESSFLSFGGFLGEQEINETVGMFGNYRLMLDNDKLTRTSEVPGLRNMNSCSGPIMNSCSTSKGNPYTGKSKEPKTVKKPASNNFPSNVKSLISTGMFDGVPVKYVSWSREKNLRGIISGSGYLCSCSDCNLSKSLNAYEFEQHAGCKTKHPNNHIYFENGKTIYAVVQELKNTPQELLFDAIQTVTGAPIDQKNYRAWKASYQAATRELQRIYGKDEIILPS